MKKILGLDLGTTSIGWAFVLEAENEAEVSKIIRAGVRIVPVSSEDESNFSKGQTVTINANRRAKRSARRNLQRFKLRREALIKLLNEVGFIGPDFHYAETGSNSTHSNYELRARAATDKVSLEELAKVFLMLNAKRGYKSNRKVNNEEEAGENTVGSIQVAEILHREDLTPGQWVFRELVEGRTGIPDFYASDLEEEIRRIIRFQANFHSDIFNEELIEKLLGKSRREVMDYFHKTHGIPLAENKGKVQERRLQQYEWRSKALETALDPSITAYLLAEITTQIVKVSGYLGRISDRSKVLHFEKLTVGQYLHRQLKENPLRPIKNQVFYRQDYNNEFETIWNTQQKFYPELTPKLKKHLKDIIIYYQRPLRSQKHLLSNCPFEPNRKVIPKSHPLFQVFRTYQNLNNVRVYHPDKPADQEYLGVEHLQQLADSLLFRESMTASELLKIIEFQDYKCNFEKIEGNRTHARLLQAFKNIIEWEDDVEIKLNDLSESDMLDQFSEAFLRYGIDPHVLKFDADLSGEAFEKQPYMMLWHLLYSIEDEKALKRHLKKRFGFRDSHLPMLLAVRFEQDYGSLSSNAIRKILPKLKMGLKYSEACVEVGYNHSNSKTKEEDLKRVLKEKLDLLPRNSLRNPIVEKILNHLINIVNAIIEHPEMGRPDEIRIELARDLKSSADERKRTTKMIGDKTRENEEVRKILENDYRLPIVTKNDIIRYKLWKETGGISLYTGRPIESNKLFSAEYDIEHIIPRSRLFDDSFANKTLCERNVNIEKGNQTAYSYLKNKSPEELAQYLARVKDLSSKISKTKYQRLLTPDDKLPEDFITRQLRETQYITSKAKDILLDVTRSVVVSTGMITDKLRNDWGLEELLKELNLQKYKQVGLVKYVEDKSGNRKQKIEDWSKRDDHRHHAMDAITVAFTKQAYIQYLNNLNAKSNQGYSEKGIETKYTQRQNGRVAFLPPMDNMRAEVAKALEAILVSYKAKSKVTTRSLNKIKVKGGFLKVWQEAPRGQLHNETLYGKIKRYEVRYEKLGSSFDEKKIALVAKKKEREALQARLAQFDNDPKQAFTGKNAPSKNPIYLNEAKSQRLGEKVKLVEFVDVFTTRKAIGEDLKLDKVVDHGIKKRLEEHLKKEGSAKVAFANLDEKPIFQNREKSIPIKKVTITGVANAISLGIKRDHLGNEILSEHGRAEDAHYINTGNNHHVVIYEDENGGLQAEVVSFFEAVARRNQGLPVVKREHENGWKFRFSMKINEMFVFPSEDFSPHEIDLMNPANYPMISKNLFRVQKLSINPIDFWFRHHLETKLNDDPNLKGIAFKRLRNLNGVADLIKIRISNNGDILGAVND